MQLMTRHTCSITVTPSIDGPSSRYEPTKQTASRWLTVPQAARYLGLECPGGRAPTSVYEIANAIGFVVGGRWLIDVDDLDQWVRSRRQGASA
jgi:hypothetical protein